MKLFLIIFLLTANNFAFSQNDRRIIDVGNNTIIKGKVIAEQTGKPIESKIEFRAKDGKKIKTVSNSITGEWQLLIPAGDYSVILENWNVARQIETVQVVPDDSFNEVVRDFVVRRILPNDKVFAIAAFPKNSKNIDKNSFSIIDDLKQVMRFNRAVVFNIYVNASDTDKKSGTESIINHRVKEVEEYFKDWGNLMRRINIKPDYSNSKTNNHNNLVVIVESNEDIFNK